jgi:nucleoside-diphosphate-sugar epimerase
MKAVVTGATGFVGSRLARHLAGLGHQVSILVRPTSSFDQLDGILDRIDVRVVDDSQDSLRAALAAVRPDVVFHVATYYAFDHTPQDVERMLEANIAFPLRLIDAMAREGIGCLVNTGSAWQHFKDAHYDPVCLHSATKQAFQILMEYFVNIGKLRAITLLLNDTYGPKDPRRKIFAMVKEAADKPEPLKMSAGTQLVELVHAEDIVRAYVLAAERLLGMPEIRNEEYNVSTGKPLPLKDLVAMFTKLAGIRENIEWGARPFRDREVMVPWTTGKWVPGWEPNVSLEQGLPDLLV